MTRVGHQGRLGKTHYLFVAASRIKLQVCFKLDVYLTVNVEYPQLN